MLQLRYKRDSVIVNYNEVPPGLFFILKGQIWLTHPVDINTPLITMTEGSYFGDPVLMLDNQFLNVKWASFYF